MTFSASIEEADLTFDKTSGEQKPMAMYEGRRVYIHRDYLDQVVFGKSYHCQIEWKEDYGFASIISEIEDKEKNNGGCPASEEKRIEPGSLIEDIILFNRMVDNRATSTYRDCITYVDGNFAKDVAVGDSYLCKLHIPTGEKYYIAIPEKKITIEEILNMDPEYLDQIVNSIYERSPSSFNELITGKILERERAGIRTEYDDEINYLKKENERLNNQLRETAANDRSARPQTALPELSEYISDRLFFSEKLEERYYSTRVNLGKSRVMLVKDDKGEINSSGKAVPIESICKILGSDNIKGHWCDKCEAIVFQRVV